MAKMDRVFEFGLMMAIALATGVAAYTSGELLKRSPALITQASPEAEEPEAPCLTELSAPTEALSAYSQVEPTGLEFTTMDGARCFSFRAMDGMFHVAGKVCCSSGECRTEVSR